MGKLEDLQKLKELKDTGVLTEKEYEIEKFKVLNSNDEKEGNTDRKSKKALIGFILGLCSLIAWYIPIIGFPVTVLGIIFSALGINSKDKGLALLLV